MTDIAIFVRFEKLSQRRSLCPDNMTRQNINNYSSYGFCNTLYYFFSKNVEQRLKIEITPIKTASCAFHFGFGTHWDKTKAALPHYL